MRNKRTFLPFLPGFLVNFAHAMQFKGGGAPTVQTPTYEPPKPPPSPDSAVNYDVARTYFEGNYKGENQAYTDPWNDEFNAWTSGLESDFGVDSYEKLNYGQLTGQVKPGTTGTTGGGTPPPTPPAPDAPVQSSTGTITQPTPSQPIPPVSDRSSEVQQAGREARRNSKKRKGLLSTLLAGETGGASAPTKTLLGQ